MIRDDTLSVEVGQEALDIATHEVLEVISFTKEWITLRMSCGIGLKFPLKFFEDNFKIREAWFCEWQTPTFKMEVEGEFITEVDMAKEPEVGDTYATLLQNFRKVGRVKIASKLKFGDNYFYDYAMYLHTDYIDPTEKDPVERMMGVTHDPEFWLLERAMHDLRIEK